jgi:hypothetical protein
MRESWQHSPDQRSHILTVKSRELSLDDKCKLIDDMYRVQRALHAIYVRCFLPDATDQEVVDHWARITCEPELYVAVREKRAAEGYDTLPLPMPPDIRMDTLIRRLLTMERRQVFCEQYHEPVLDASPV